MIKITNNWILLNGRRTGYISEGVYISERNVEEHFYVMGGGYPIANEILHWLKEHDVNNVMIIEKRKSGIRKWGSTVDDYLKSVLIEHPPFEQQRCLPLQSMEEIK